MGYLVVAGGKLSNGDVNEADTNLQKAARYGHDVSGLLGQCS
jgi:hypothetical protein